MRTHRPLWWLLAGLAVFRLAYFLGEEAMSPFWGTPLADAEVYDAIARAMAGGSWFEPSMSYRPFLYPLWLGAVYSIAGPAPEAAYLFQGLLGLGTVALVYACSLRLFGARAAFAAALLCGLYGPLAAAETKLLDTALSAFLQVAALAALLAARGAAGHFGTGLLLGLAAAARPPLLLFAALGVFWGARRAGPKATAGLLAGVGLVLVSLSAWNYAASGTFSPLPRNGGVTFYAGNNARAEGDYSVAPGLTGEARTQEAEEAALPRSGFALGLDWILSNPLGALRLWAIKLHRFALADEPPLEHDFFHERATVPILFALPIPFSVLFLLGLMGLALRRPPGAGLVAAAIAVHLATALAFFVATRYRALAAPLLAIAAGGAFLALAEAWRAGRYRFAAVTLLGVAAGAGLLAYSPYEDERARAAVADYNAGLAWERRGDLVRAYDHYVLAAGANPRMAEVWVQRGNLELIARRPLSARAHYQRALALRADHPRALANLALLELRRRPPGLEEARRLLERAHRASPWDAGIALQLGDARRAAGDGAGAVRAFSRVTQIAPADARGWSSLGHTLLALSRQSAEASRALLAPAGAALLRATELGSLDAARRLEALGR